MSRYLEGVDVLGALPSLSVPRLFRPTRVTPPPRPLVPISTPSVTHTATAPLPSAPTHPLAAPPAPHPAASIVRPKGKTSVPTKPTKKGVDATTYAAEKHKARLKIEAAVARLKRAAAKVARKHPGAAARMNASAARAQAKASSVQGLVDDIEEEIGAWGLATAQPQASAFGDLTMQAPTFDPVQVQQLLADMGNTASGTNAIALAGELLTQVDPALVTLSNQANPDQTLVQQGNDLQNQLVSVTQYGDPTDPTLPTTVAQLQTKVNAWLQAVQGGGVNITLPPGATLPTVGPLPNQSTPLPSDLTQEMQDLTPLVPPPSDGGGAPPPPPPPPSDQGPPPSDQGGGGYAPSDGGRYGGGGFDGGGGYGGGDGSLDDGSAGEGPPYPDTSDYFDQGDQSDQDDGGDEGIDWGTDQWADDGSQSDQSTDDSDLMGDDEDVVGARIVSELIGDTIPQAVYDDSGTILAVQQALAQAGFNPGPQDGIFGPKTSNAIKRMQAVKGLPQTGVVDSSVILALNVTPGANAGRTEVDATKIAVQKALAADDASSVKSAADATAQAAIDMKPPPSVDIQKKIMDAHDKATSAKTPAEVADAQKAVLAAANELHSSTTFWGKPLWDGAPIKRWQGVVGGIGVAGILAGLVMMVRK